MKVLIVGCGYLGKMLGERLARSGHEVWGLRRDWAGLPLYGIKPITADLLKPESLQNLPMIDSVVLCQAPNRKDDDYQKTYYQGTKNLIQALSVGANLRVRPNDGNGQTHRSAPTIVFISSTSVYSIKDGSWVDEDTALSVGATHASPLLSGEIEWLLKTEEFLLKETSSVIFRLGGIYGPGRNRLNALRNAGTGSKPVPTGFVKSFSDAFVNRIHAEDAVRGIELLLEKGKIGEIYLGVDDYPSTQKEFYGWIYEKLSLPERTDNPIKEVARTSNKRCSNKKIKALGLKFKYPTFREGYSQLIDDK